MDADTIANFSNLLYTCGNYRSGDDRGYFEVCEQLDKEPKLLEACDRYGDIPLIIAVYKANVRLIEELLRRGARVEAKDQWGDSALTAAVETRQISLVKLLLNAGADPNTRNRREESVLFVALQGKGYDKKTEIAAVLIKGGAEVQEAEYAHALKNMHLLLSDLFFISYLVNARPDLKTDSCSESHFCLLHASLTSKYRFEEIYPCYLALQEFDLTQRCWQSMEGEIGLIERGYSPEIASIVLINAYQNNKVLNEEALRGIIQSFEHKSRWMKLEFSELLRRYVTADLIVRKLFLPLFYQLEENHKAKQFSGLDPQHQVVLMLLFEVIIYAETSLTALLGWIYFQQWAGPQLFATEVINLIVGGASPIYNYCRTFDPDAVQYGITLKQAHTIILRLFDAYLTLASAQAVYPEFFQEQETKSLLKQEVEDNKPISFVNYLATFQLPKLKQEAAELTPQILEHYALR
jgi:hypothetical protein